LSPEQKSDLCKTIKRLGYTKDHQVELYGRVFEITSDPVCLGEHLVFVDAREPNSRHTTRVRIPMNIVQKAQQSRHDA